MTSLPPELVTYLADRDRHRAARVDTALATLRPYERRVVLEAAVMGYVLGHRDGGIDTRQATQRPFPRDAQILADVIAHCDSSSRTYPYLGEACDGRRRRVTAGRRWPGEEAAR